MSFALQPTPISEVGTEQYATVRPGTWWYPAVLNGHLRCDRIHVTIVSSECGHGVELFDPGPRRRTRSSSHGGECENRSRGSWREAELFARFNTAVSEWLGGGRGQVVVDAAVHATVDGLESHNITCLAGATRRDADAEANEWIPKIASEFGIAFPDRLSPAGVLRAARVDAWRFVRDDSAHPSEFVAQLWGRYLESGYSAALSSASSLDDQYELIADGVIPDHAREEVDAEAQVLAHDLISTQLLGADRIFDEFWIGDCGVVARDWNATASDFRERTQVPAAQANATLASTLAREWERRAVLKTSMHDLLFLRPGDEPYSSPPMLRVSWSAEVFTFTLERRAGVLAADQCFEPTAPAVLTAFLCQLVGGEP
jgi:hypothetical protein